jgi:hypothetical protein
MRPVASCVSPSLLVAYCKKWVMATGLKLIFYYLAMFWIGCIRETILGEAISVTEPAAYSLDSPAGELLLTYLV